MTLWVFLLVVLAAILHAGWNFAAKQAAGNPGALWLGVCLGAVLSWPCAVLAHRAEPLRLGPVSYIVAVREFAVVIGSILGFVVLKERLTVRKGIGIAAITLGLALVKVA
jgi:uncharacterized membrane protein